MINVKHLNKTYYMGDTVLHALKDVSLDVDEGEFVAIMGPSGSGKSTFMNILGCLDKPSKGSSYLLDNREVADMDDDQLAEIRNRKIGFVFQTFNLIPRRSVLKQVLLPLQYNPETKNAEARALNALEHVGLGDRVNHKPNELSGGQQQRVAIARAIVTDPVIILGDEPTGNLDTRRSEEIMVIFQELHRSGKTLVVVTHEEDIAQHMQRIVRFKDGRIVSDDPVKNPLDAREVLKTMPAEGD